MLAVIKTGGKQYIVTPGQKIKIEKLDKKAGDEVVFDDVFLVEKSNKLDIGLPKVTDIKVTGKVLEQGKHKKIIVFKFKTKKRYKKKQGHRQPYTEVEITKIG